MRPQRWVPQHHVSEPAWPAHLFRPLVLAVMVGCIAWSVSQVIRLFAPDWSATYLVLGCVLAAVEAYYSSQLLRSHPMLRFDVVKFRTAELLMLYLVLRLGNYAVTGWNDLLADIRAWPDDASLIFSLETLVAYVLAFFSWDAATQTAKDLGQIGEPPERHRGYVPPIQRIAGRFFGGGVVLLVSAGLVRLGGAAGLLDLSRPSARGLVINVLIYFLLGFVMLGQARFLELRQRWENEKIAIAGEVAGRWARYSLIFIGLAALLAFLLPTGFTASALDLVAVPLGILGSVFSYLTSLVVTLVLLPLSWLYWLLGKLFGTGRPAPQPDLPPFEPPTPPASGGGWADWLQLLRLLILSAALVAVVYFIVRRYVRDRPGLWQTWRRLRPIRLLRRAWTALWHGLQLWTRRVGQTVSEHLPRRLLRERAVDSSSGLLGRFFRLGARSPRERILYYYLSVVKRARQQGYPRARDQTPYEYQQKLGPHLSGADQAFDALTQAFVEVRYSHHEVEADQDQRTRTHWERVKAALRALKRGRKADGP